MKKPVVDPLQALQQKLADTQALLQQERLKNQVLQTVIKIAKKEFQIPIRKKSAGMLVRFPQDDLQAGDPVDRGVQYC